MNITRNVKLSVTGLYFPGLALLLVSILSWGNVLWAGDTNQGASLFTAGMIEYNNQNFGNAVKLFRQAAEQGHADAQYSLGDCYSAGGGVAQDYFEAAKWYRRAAEQGHAAAQYDLGSCYATGKGVAKDDAEAVKWFRRAAEQGHIKAQENLDSKPNN